MSESRVSLGINADGSENFEIKDELGNVIGYEVVFLSE
jgi:hypothetical protein